MKGTNILLALIVAGATTLAACGGGNKGTNDSTSVSTMDSSSTSAMPDTSLSDTVPGAQVPAGAANPGEDSARYGTGTNDTSKTHKH